MKVKPCFMLLLVGSLSYLGFSYNDFAFADENSKKIGLLQNTLQEATAGNDPIAVLTTLKIMLDLEFPIGKYDLCQLNIPNVHLFCKKNIGVGRITMPQLIGIPRDKSPAAQLPKNKNGMVDATEQFKTYLQKRNYTFTPKKVPAVRLKSTQNELIGSKIASLWWLLKKNPNHQDIRAPIFISKDNYILDGHHRWAAIIAMDFEDGDIGNVSMNTIQINAPIKDLVTMANQFVKEFGLLHQSA